jgi:hypothetical protein
MPAERNGIECGSLVERYLHGMSYHDILRHITEGLPADAVRFVQLVALAEGTRAGCASLG